MTQRTTSLQVAGYEVDPSILPTGWAHNSVQPRVGFAYNIDNKSVVRGGFAMSAWGGGSDLQAELCPLSSPSSITSRMAIPGATG